MHVGLEPDSLDPLVDPCVDFYQFACGGWISQHPIPADYGGYARITQIEDTIRAQLETMLQADADGNSTDPNDRMLGDFYASCVDEVAIERVGTSPAQQVLGTALAVRDDITWIAAVVALHRLGFEVVWNESVSADSMDSTRNVIVLDAGGLELPDRDYYLSSEFSGQLSAYRAHAAKMLVLAGLPAAGASRAADDVLAIETAIARLTKTRTDSRDAVSTYNPTTPSGLAKMATSIDWSNYWKAMSIDPGDRIVVGTPTFFEHLDSLRRQFQPAQWAHYFAYHAISSQSFSLGKSVDDEDFALQSALTGVPTQASRSKRCVEETKAALGEVLGQQYAERYFPAASKLQVEVLTDSLVRAMSETISKLEWLSAPTRSFALQKLSKVSPMVGFPETWRPGRFLVKRDDFGGNELRRFEFTTHQDLARAGQLIDRREWKMNAYSVNAYFDYTSNNLALPAGVLQLPFFNADRSPAVNLGALGMLIGHELTHGFDDQGARFDDKGNLRDWWAPSDKPHFEQRADWVAHQYSSFEALPHRFVNGRLTLGEDIADLGGVKIAFNAYRSLTKGPRMAKSAGQRISLRGLMT